MSKDWWLFLAYGCLTAGQFERKLDRMLDLWRANGSHIVDGLLVENADDGSVDFLAYPMLNNARVSDYYRFRMRHPWRVMCQTGLVGRYEMNRQEIGDKVSELGTAIHFDELNFIAFINRS